MEILLQKKILRVIVSLFLALVSVVFLSGLTSSPEFHKSTLAALEEKQSTVLELSAASAAASAAITLIPGDVATPIANKLADLSSHFILVLCAILLEKYLLTITGTITFSLLVPLACILYVMYVLFDWKSLQTLATKLALFGLLIFFVIPASVHVSDMIEATYHTSIEATIDTAATIVDEIEEDADSSEKDDDGFLAGLVSSVTESVTGAISRITDKAGEIVNRFIEALAIMLVTCCIIPILVLLSFVWFAKILLAVDLPINYFSIHQGIKNNLFAKKTKNAQ